MNSAISRNIFTYGSLMYPEVMYNIVEKNDYKSQPALLKNYSRKQVKGAVYPGLVRADNHEIWGVVYINVERSDVERLDRFQGY